MDSDLSQICDAWGLTAPTQIADTPRSLVYAVRQQNGANAALKLYTDAGWRSEAAQAAGYLMWDGQGAVRCLAQLPGAILMEFVSGQTLGDLSRAGRDREAAELLADAAVRLRCPTRPAGARELPSYTRALAELPADVFDTDQAALIRRAQGMLADLLNTAPAPAFLHGDLHHDNVALSDRGWLSYDPKVVWGDPHFEFANTFRNPVGIPAENLTAERAKMMAQIFAARSGLEYQRLLRWGAVKALLSIAWFYFGGHVPENQWSSAATIMNATE